MPKFKSKMAVAIILLCRGFGKKDYISKYFDHFDDMN